MAERATNQLWVSLRLRDKPAPNPCWWTWRRLRRRGVLRATARPRRLAESTGQLRHERASRFFVERLVSPRNAYPRHHPGHLRLPPRPGHQWSFCKWARTPAMPYPPPRNAPPSKCSPPIRSRRYIQSSDGVTPTPVTTSRAIIVYNRGRKTDLADGIVIAPVAQPPEDGGFKYNPTNGGPADTGYDALGAGSAPNRIAARK